MAQISLVSDLSGSAGHCPAITNVPSNGHVILSFDSAVVTTKNQLRKCVANLLAQVDSGVGGLK